MVGRCSGRMAPETCGIATMYLLEAPVLPKSSLLCRLSTSAPDSIPLHTTLDVMPSEVVLIPHLPHAVTARPCASCKQSQLQQNTVAVASTVRSAGDCVPDCTSAGEH